MPSRADPADTTTRTVFVTERGDQVRFEAVHGRVDVIVQDPSGRYRHSTPTPTGRIRLLARRLDEICAVAEAGGFPQTEE